MTNDELQDHINAIMELLREGRIQRRFIEDKPKNWNTANAISLDPHPSYEYRIAPQPLECWGWQYEDGSYDFRFHTSKTAAVDHYGVDAGCAVRMTPAEDTE